MQDQQAVKMELVSCCCCQCSDPFDLKTYHSLLDLIQIWRMLVQVQPPKLLYCTVCQQHLELILAAAPQAYAMSQVKVASQGPAAAYCSPSRFSEYHPANFSSVHEPFHHLPFAPFFRVFCLSFDQDERPQSFHHIESGLNGQEVSQPSKYCFQPFTEHDLLAIGKH